MQNICCLDVFLPHWNVSSTYPCQIPEFHVPEAKYLICNEITLTLMYPPDKMLQCCWLHAISTSDGLFIACYDFYISILLTSVGLVGVECEVRTGSRKKQASVWGSAEAGDGASPAQGEPFSRQKVTDSERTHWGWILRRSLWWVISSPEDSTSCPDETAD